MELRKREFGCGNPTNVRNWHKLGSDSFPYCDKLAKEAGLDYETRLLSEMFDHTFDIRSKIGLTEYRKVQYRKPVKTVLKLLMRHY